MYYEFAVMRTRVLARLFDQTRSRHPKFPFSYFGRLEVTDLEAVRDFSSHRELLYLYIVWIFCLLQLENQNVRADITNCNQI